MEKEKKRERSCEREREKEIKWSMIYIYGEDRDYSNFIVKDQNIKQSLFRYMIRGKSRHKTSQIWLIKALYIIFFLKRISITIGWPRFPTIFEIRLIDELTTLQFILLDYLYFLYKSWNLQCLKLIFLWVLLQHMFFLPNTLLIQYYVYNY